MGLEKIQNDTFNEYYEGANGTRRVICILDDFCVRYMVFEDGRRKSRREFPNNKKNLCLQNAAKALDR